MELNIRTGDHYKYETPGDRVRRGNKTASLFDAYRLVPQAAYTEFTYP